MLLSVNALEKSFGADRPFLLDKATFRIDRHEKVALVGRNGTGKTTLLNILTGSLAPDGGSVNLARGAKLGYLRQEAPVDPRKTVLEEAEEARREALAIKARLRELEQQLQLHPRDEDLEEYATLHEHYVEIEGYSAERDMRTVLAKLGFEDDELNTPTGALSGGQRTRLALARLLLEQPDLLLLDEPTNHLDLQATEWLERWLSGYPGAVLLVSHDRAFLENAADRVLELREGAVKSYPGPFSKYLQLRNEEDVRRTEVAKRQQQEIDKLDEYVRRFINTQRTAQARGRRKQMEKLASVAVTAPKEQRSMRATFTEGARSGDLVAEAKGLEIGYGKPLVAKSLNWAIRRGERWGVIGENGAGKSTLIRTLLGVLTPIGGSVRLGSRVAAGYFAQDTVDLDPDQSPLDYLVWEFDMLPAEARNLLGRFLITGDDVYRPIHTLSGGEKNKLAVASLTTLHPNLLVLDEPTNHLDMASREALREVLAEYAGTLILVSHDRWLLGETTDHTLDLRRSGAILYPGSYGEYVRSIAGERTSHNIRAVEDASPLSLELGARELSKEIGRVSRMVEGLEDQIYRDEQALADLERRLSDLPANADVLALTRDHAGLQERIAAGMSAWEEHSERLAFLRGRQGTGVPGK